MRHARTPISLLAATLLGIVVALLSAGCAGPTDAVVAYQQGRYESALLTARREANQAGGQREARAALTAGMAAHALGRHEEAAQWLRPLTSHSDAAIAGRAAATLGLIEHANGREAEASRLLARAADLLDGPASERAAELSGRTLLASRRSEGHPAARTMGSLFTVQIGAFSTRHNAEEAASMVRPKALGAGFGAPHIAASTDGQGSRLYLVQVGRFSNRDRAELAMRRLGGGLITSTQAF